MSSGASTDVLAVQEEVRSAFLKSEGRRRTVSVRQLVEQGLGSEPEVVTALMMLRGLNALNVQAVVHCPNGHEVWRGSPEEVRSNLFRRCRTCWTAERNSEDDITYRFTISEPWAKRLALELEKKTAGYDNL